MVETVIAGGESYYVEFKSAWHYGPEGREKREIREVAKDIAEAVVAFANSDGGELLVGVEDDGSVTGVPWEGDQLLYLVNVPKTGVQADDLGVVVNRVDHDGRLVLWFRISEASREVITQDGRCLWRRETNTEPVPPQEIRRRRAHVRGDVFYEALPVPTARLEDLDEEVIRTLFPFGAQPGAPIGEHLGKLQRMPIEQVLRYWNLADSRNGTIVLRRAALLLFAKEPLRWHPNHRIRIRRVYEREEGFGGRLGTREKEIIRPIPVLIRDTIQVLHRQLEVERQSGSLFSTTQLLPRTAIEETVVNAVAHRNYAVEGQAIEVLLYPDRVEVRSPGRLPETVTVKDLLAQRGVHRSRNPLIMRVLRDLGWSRDQGEGMRRIFGSMRQVELHQPELEERADTFIVRLSTRSIYDEGTQAWIAAYGPFGLRPEDRRYMVGLREAGGSLSTDKLARQLNESFDETKRHLERMERAGLLWRTYKGRTYHVVEATNVPHELAWRRVRKHSIAVDRSTHLKRSDLEKIFGVEDHRSFESALAQWQQAGILRPAGKARWGFGESFLQYASQRA